MIITALGTGLRLGELLGLQWKDVDEPKRRIHVRRAIVRGEITTPKNGRERMVPLLPEVVDTLRRHKHNRGPFVFCNRDGSALTRSQTRDPLYGACTSAGVKRIGWHGLRHSAATHFAQAGVDLLTISAILGHQSPDVTTIYAHVTQKMMEDAIGRRETLGHYLGNKKKPPRRKKRKSKKKPGDPTGN